mmetsp:Transcript_22411/g.57075  ORF Transcript_22411/g.57075 Transcript_22411/m.57075 type:complete len:204 (-) Transcript_22411:255-866(-)
MCLTSTDPIASSGSRIRATWSGRQCSTMRCTTRQAYSFCAAFTMDFVPLATSSSMMNCTALGRIVMKHFCSTWFAWGHRIAVHTRPRSSCTSSMRASSVGASSRAAWTLRQPSASRESRHMLPSTGRSRRLSPFSLSSDTVDLSNAADVIDTIGAIGGPSEFLELLWADNAGCAVAGGCCICTGSPATGAGTAMSTRLCPGPT